MKHYHTYMYVSQLYPTIHWYVYHMVDLRDTKIKNVSYKLLNERQKEGNVPN